MAYFKQETYTRIFLTWKISLSRYDYVSSVFVILYDSNDWYVTKQECKGPVGVTSGDPFY